MIAVKELEKRYGDVRAVSGVTFEVAAGEIVGLLGQNGAGKTTVMKVMTGFLEPTSGTVAVGGLDVRTDRIGVQKQIGYLPEHAPLYPEMLVQEYLLMMADLRGVPKSERAKRVAAAVKATGLEQRVTQPISQLSKGYRQRVGLAQAILHQPKVLVLDEPTNGLDPVQILEIRALIRELAKTTTVILSTHILSEIEAVCSRVVILIEGQKAADATLEEMLSSDVVRVAVADAKDAAGALAEVEGVSDVRRAGEKDGYQRYTVKVAAGARPEPAIAKLAVEKGWTLGEVARATPSLESVFRELMAAHVAQRKEAA
ncbi:MAG: ATP-binding cassette domain-containing protein [Myxococcales bacterium]|nr:ATP-binding cassette domain-containing protein [Myxococcales bacterium]